MKKITLLFLTIMLGSVSAFAQFSFPDAGSVLVAADADPQVTFNMNDAANTAGVTAGTYASFSVSADWVVGGGNPWSSEAEIFITTASGTVEVDPPTTGGATNADATTLTFEGEFLALYDPSVDGTLDLILDQSYAGSDATWSNIIVTVFPPPACGDVSNVAASPADINADFSWDAPVAGTPTGYNWEIQPDGVAQGTAGALASGVAAGTTVNSGDVLTASTAYEFYVQTDCGVDGTAAYLTVGFTTTSGPAPANDDFANAEVAVCGMNYTGSTENASLDEDYAGEPAGGADFDAPNVWFSFTGTGTEEEVTLSLCGSDYDTAIMVYTGTSGNLTQVAENEDADACGAAAPESYRSFLTFVSDGTTTYYIAVEGWNVGDTGNYDLAVSCVPAIAAPANDLCANAEGLSIGVAATGTTAGAGVDAADANPNCESGLASIVDVWYSFAATEANMTVMTVLGTADQANVAVYTNDCALATQVGCADANGGETLDLTGLTVNDTYLVRVWNDGIAPPPPAGEGRIEGDFTISVDVTLSTGSLDNENAFTYFPNPVKNELTLNSQKDIQNVSVYNMLGQEVLRTAPNATDSTINMNELSQGAYFVKVTIGDVTETVRVIKQ